MIVSVSQLNNYIKGVMELDETLNLISVKGEVTSCKFSHGNLYLTLSDDDGQIDCFAFGDRTEAPEVGLNVIVTGRVRYLPRFGKISFLVNKIERADFGQNYLRFIQLREKLQKEGIFDLSRKKSLPVMPRKIAVVSSRTGAVIRDITDVVRRRQPFSDILLYPVHVQGDSAEEEIVQGIKYFSENPVADVLIVARGGGSNEDLSVFNSESIVRAVAQCPLPTVSAIGHGVDFTLTDFAADARAVTPTEAGELVTRDITVILSDIFRKVERLYNVASEVVKAEQYSLGRALYAMYSAAGALAEQRKNRILNLLAVLSQNCGKLCDARSNRIELLLQRLSDNNPANILAKGYLSVTKKGDRVVSVKQLQKGDCVSVLLADGSADAVISRVEVDNETGRKHS